ncbi:hypothetical protein [Streptomyces sp. WMMB 322]|uniref:hypothetical protein n=1 Tax=Streptomyces sp. WMMB 322 TaxID=1286821 RepID=UPI0006E313DD|nr:hypothetical protein [Streptomyces sp. WMMB 322]
MAPTFTSRRAPCRWARPPCSSSGSSDLAHAVEKAELKARKHVAKELDVSAKDLDEAVRKATAEVG